MEWCPATSVIPDTAFGSIDFYGHGISERAFCRSKNRRSQKSLSTSFSESISALSGAMDAASDLWFWRNNGRKPALLCDASFALRHLCGVVPHFSGMQKEISALWYGITALLPDSWGIASGYAGNLFLSVFPALYLSFFSSYKSWATVLGKQLPDIKSA